MDDGPTRDRSTQLVEALTDEERYQLLSGDADPTGTATGYLPSIERLGIPAFRLVDGPAGVRIPGEPATAFPAPIALAAAWDPSLANEQGAAIAREALAYGQDAVLGPGLNLIRTPHCGRNFEYYSEDPYLTSRLGVATVEGIQSEGVIATAKHYVANNQETERYSINADVSERALRECYLPAFRAVVEEADVGSIMTAYNRVNDSHMSEHRRLLTDVLRDEFGFEGYVVSDWFGTESAVDAANAGLDVEMPGVDPELFLSAVEDDSALEANADLDDALSTAALPTIPSEPWFGEPLRTAVADGRIDSTTIDTKLQRLLGTMERFGVLDGDSEGALDTAGHRELARRIATEGSVLLKNEDVLPLSTASTIALCGPNADETKRGGGSSEVIPTVKTSPLDGLKARAPSLTFERGVDPVPETSLFDVFSTADSADTTAQTSIPAAVDAATAADCAVVVVQDDATEGQDRDDLRLPGDQNDLVASVAEAASRTVVVVRASGPVELPWLDTVDAVLVTWYPGQADGTALADVLYGDADPGGRLPVTFAEQAQYPTAPTERFPGKEGTVAYGEDVFVGYPHFDCESIEPLFPFGHGLSYARFEYGDVTLDSDEHDASGQTVSVSVPVENVSDRAGTEVVQAYLGGDTLDSTVTRPERELAAFEKLHLNPGERRIVSLSLEERSFAHYEESDGWTVPAGSYTISVGRSSRDLRAQTSVTIS
ncbi:beta-glucosidase [Halocatena pleomorpha]|uniref:Glycosyl hydrolase n=1 Tax=Halocatena pleomorpha TaxID=1785090 RepID=A0A3P3R4K3_9EURY|nr:glycoside hydrolase family 3 C-terminal domain-containing protein [Halocatena pleomorpha]RRJ28416.1 glycosyl hydrolase [Halocatena pleomorpha]